jgi:hypothetical protein
LAERKPVIEETRENPYSPQGWDKHDLKSASMQFRAFVNTSQGWHWIANYLGVKQRHYERKMAPANPSEVSHGAYIELAARVSELTLLARAIETLVGLEEEIGKEQSRGEKAEN